MATITAEELERFVAETEALQGEDEKRASNALIEKLALVSSIEKITGKPIEEVSALNIFFIEAGWNARKEWERTQ